MVSASFPAAAPVERRVSGSGAEAGSLDNPADHIALRTTAFTGRFQLAAFNPYPAQGSHKEKASAEAEVFSLWDAPQRFSFPPPAAHFLLARQKKMGGRAPGSRRISAPESA